MGFTESLLLRGICDRAHERLSRKYGSGKRASVLALALGHACYPDARFGDGTPKDETVRLLGQLSPRPCDPRAAWEAVEKWLHHGEMRTREVFHSVWDADPEQLLERYFAEQRRFERQSEVDIDACYATLEIEFGASLEQIEEAYKALVLVWHPDRFGHDAELRTQAEAKLKQINHARDCLLSRP